MKLSSAQRKSVIQAITPPTPQSVQLVDFLSKQSSPVTTDQLVKKIYLSNISNAVDRANRNLAKAGAGVSVVRNGKGWELAKVQ